MSGAVIRLLPKMAAIEATLKACSETVQREKPDGSFKDEPKCKPQDVAVVAHVVSSIDRATGYCTQHYQTIADGCGMSRSAAGRSIKRLVDAGIIERAPRHARNGAQISTAFTISRHPKQGTPPSQERHAYFGSSHDSLNPGRPSKNRDRATKPERPQGSEFDWSEAREWLRKTVNYPELFGDGAGYMASDDLVRWRGKCGDRAVIKAIENARANGLKGGRLLDFMENTWPSRSGTE